MKKQEVIMISRNQYEQMLASYDSLIEEIQALKEQLKRATN